MKTIEVTRERILELVGKTNNEEVLKEVYRILEMQAGNDFQLTEEEMDKLEEAEAAYDRGETTPSWNEIRNRLLSKLKP
jgi:hypothetical protein